MYLFSIFQYHLSLEKGIAICFNKNYIPSTKNALCTDWIKSAQWFWRGFLMSHSTQKLFCLYSQSAFFWKLILTQKLSFNISRIFSLKRVDSNLWDKNHVSWWSCKHQQVTECLSKGFRKKDLDLKFWST